MLLFFGMLLVPDTPNSLAERDKPEEARRVLERIRGTGKVDAEMKSIIAAVEKGNKVADTIFHPRFSCHHGLGQKTTQDPAIMMVCCQHALHAVHLDIAGMI